MSITSNSTQIQLGMATVAVLIATIVYNATRKYENQIFIYFYKEF
jgi:hypothetical protein